MNLLSLGWNLLFPRRTRNHMLRNEREYFKIIMNMIQCPNPECNTENPADAKFCKKCGTAFTPSNNKRLIISRLQNLFTFNKNKTQETFTLDVFRNISFHPVSVVHIRFVNRFVVFLCILFSAFAIFITSSIGRTVIYDFDRYARDYIDYVAKGCSIIVGICIIYILKWVYRKFQYKLNADYIEDSFCGDRIVRIAQKSRMGLFDKSKNKVLLSSMYSNIEHFDNEHLLLIKGKQKGLYSLIYKKIIIPVQYDSIAQFTNSVTTVTSQNVAFHYDIKGNKLR